MLPSISSGESPPPAPRACFGRDDLIEEIVTLTENLTPVALVGAGGIGKTSIALTILHHDRVKQRFGENRRFIRCDQFPATLTHLLSRLSKVIGAGVENPEDLTPLRPFLSSKEIILLLDNAESILDPQGTDSTKIYTLVEELSELPTLCLCITSRISTIPPECEILEIPALPMDAACHTFYHIYKREKRSNFINGILEQLDFHPLSITLLATVAHQNKWGTDRLKREWEKRRTSVLRTRHNKSLAATIELSLTSPMFQEFGPDARTFLGVIAFFPQGIDENNVDWLFPTIPDGIDILDGFCTLSLTYRRNGFVTMLAPLRDYLSPENPKLSPLLCSAKDGYFARMSVNLDPNRPEFEETRWIASEDVNVEHLLDVFTTIDAYSDSVWKACANFTVYLSWHKPRPTVLRAKIEGLSDDHPFKPGCLFELSQMLNLLGNRTECKSLLTQTLKLLREQGNDQGVACALWYLCDAHRTAGRYKEGTLQAAEALQIFERLDDTVGQARCSIRLAWLFNSYNQLDAAEEAASRAVDLLLEKDEPFLTCESHCVLGEIYRSNGETKKAIHHLEIALGVASSFSWQSNLFWAHYALAPLFLSEGRFDDGCAHVERAKSYAVNNPYNLGLATELQARVWLEQGRLKEARSEALRAAEVFEKLGDAEEMERCRGLLQLIQEKPNSPVPPGQTGLNCELLQVQFSARINMSF